MNSDDASATILMKEYNGHEFEILLLDEEQIESAIVQCMTCESHLHIDIGDLELKQFLNLLDMSAQLHSDGITSGWENELGFITFDDDEEDS